MISRASIMATVTPDRCSQSFLTDIFNAGASAVRINSAHCDPETLRAMIIHIRKAVPEMKILMDTKGPEIRTLPVTDTLLKPGARLSVPLNVDPTDLNISPGAKVLIDDGAIEAILLGIDCESIRIEVIDLNEGATLRERKTVAIEDADTSVLDPLSERDRINIQIGIEEHIDMIAHSFIRSDADVEAVREIIAGTTITLFSKIECREALLNFDAILRASDGILVARGDLGANIDYTLIPTIQKEIVSKCKQQGKPTILATQIISSMVNNPIPTRSEITDIAEALAQGIDILLLTNETAVGKYPLETIRTMKHAMDSSSLSFDEIITRLRNND